MLAVLLGVAFMAGSLVFTDTMKASLSGAFQDGERSTDVAGARAGHHHDRRAAPSTRRCRAALADRLAAVDGVAAVAPRLEGFAQVARHATASPSRPQRRGHAAGAAWAADERAQPVRAGRRAARRGPTTRSSSTGRLADAADLAVGDRTSVLTGAAPQDMTVVGIATFDGQDNRAGSRTVLFTPTHGRPAARRGRHGRRHRGARPPTASPRPSWPGGVAAAIPAGDQAVTGTALTAENGERTQRGRHVLRALHDGLRRRRPARRRVHHQQHVLDPGRAADPRARPAAGDRCQRPTGAPLGRCSRRSSSVRSRPRSGWSPASAWPAASRRCWSALGIDHAGRAAGRLRPLAGRSSFVVGVVVTVASALLPARRAARVAPVAAMRAVAVEPVRVSPKRPSSAWSSPPAAAARWCSASSAGWSRRCCWVRSARCSASPPWRRCWPDRWSGCSARLLPRLVGVRGLLARENAVRNPRRTAATAVGADDRRRAGRLDHVLRGVRQALGHRVLRQRVPRRPRGRLRRLDVRRREPRAGRRAGGAAGGRRRGARQFTQAQVGDSVGRAVRLAGRAVGPGLRPRSSPPVRRPRWVPTASPSAPRTRKHHVCRWATPSRSRRVRRAPRPVVQAARRAHRLGRAGLRRPGDVRGAGAGCAGHRRLRQGAPGVCAEQLRAAVDRVAAPYANATVRDLDEMRTAVASDFNAMLGIVYACSRWRS